MNTLQLKANAKSLHHFKQFKAGDERGLAYFYQLWYKRLQYRSFKFIKDDINADCIVNEAFLRLWLFRNTIKDNKQMETLIEQLMLNGCRAFFKVSEQRFQRSLLRLDDVENYQEFLLADTGVDMHNDSIYETADDEKSKAQLAQIMNVIPNLSENQQLFIRLSIKYSFDYGRIAWHIGGISDYEVARNVEKTLVCLRNIITDSQKLNNVASAQQFRFEGDVCQEQSAILHMRYQLQYSFEDIAKALNLSQGHIQKAFSNAMLKVKKVKI